MKTRRRVLMYSHDTFGLGHLTRTLRIADAIQARFQHTSILIMSGLPVAPYLPLPPRTDLVKLPSVLKSGPERYESRDLIVDFRQIRDMRRGLIRSTAETYKPDVFLVDNVPLGMKREIEPTLEALRGKAHLVLNLRDILDAGAVIRRRWEEDAVYPFLSDCYDAVHVFGDSALFDAVEAYELPPKSTQFMGYVTPDENPAAALRSDARGEARRVLVTAGGGGDGLPLLRAATLAAAAVRERLPFPVEFDIVTGPLMKGEERRELLDLGRESGCEVHEFVSDLPGAMESADVVLAMAGYNTCCEILTRARAAVLYPRETPRLEQRIRADAFAAHGLVRSLPSGPPTAASITDALVDVIGTDWLPDATRRPRMGGQHQAARALDPWLRLEGADAESRPTTRVGGPHTSPGEFLSRSCESAEGSSLEKRLAATAAWVETYSDWSGFWPGAVAT